MLDISIAVASLCFLLVLGREAYIRWLRKDVAAETFHHSTTTTSTDTTTTLGNEKVRPIVPLDVTLASSKPIPYRPFRYGPKYAVNMGIRPLDLERESWIQVDNHFHRFHRDKLDRLASPNAERLWGSLPGSEDASLEALELLSDYLPRRYPRIYRRTPTGMAIEGCEHVDFAGQHPLVNASKLLQDDFALMLEGPDGQYYLKAGSILLAGFWKLEDKLGMPLREIHTSGDVPHYQEKLQGSMDRYFSRLKVDRPIVRNNYFIQVDSDLAWSSSIGPEFATAGEPVGWDSARVATSIDQIYFRSERQSLRRLPRSGAIMFTVRTYFHPITEIARQPNVPGRLASAVRSWDEPVRQYKGAEKYCDILLPYLDECHAAQVLSGETVDGQADYKYPL